MKRKIVCLLSLVMLVGCSQTVQKNENNNVQVEKKVDDNKKKKEENNDSKELNKSKDVEDKQDENIHMDDVYINNIVKKMTEDGFTKRNEDTKSDDTWVSISKYVKDSNDGKYIVFINKAEDSNKIHNLEDTQGYTGRVMVETKNSNIKAFQNTDDRFTIFVAYDESQKNGMIFMINGSPESKNVKTGLEYIKSLLKDII